MSSLVAYENSTFGFRLQCPPAWGVTEDAKSVIFSPPASHPLENFSVRAFRFKNAQTLSNRIQQNIVSFNRDPTFELLSSERSTIAANPSHTLVYARTINDYALKIRQVHTLRDPRTEWIVTYKTAPPNYDTYSHAAQAMTSSFAFTAASHAPPLSLDEKPDSGESIVGWFGDVVIDEKAVALSEKRISFSERKVLLIFTTARVIVVLRTAGGAAGFGLGALKTLDDALGYVDPTGVTQVVGWTLSTARWLVEKNKGRGIKNRFTDFDADKLLGLDRRNYAIPYPELTGLWVELPRKRARLAQSSPVYFTAVTSSGVHKFIAKLRWQDVGIADTVARGLQQAHLLGDKLRFVP